MLSHDGRYIVHPDTTKLIRQTIFSDPDPQAREDVMRLGDAMLDQYIFGDVSRISPEAPIPVFKEKGET